MQGIGYIVVAGEKIKVLWRSDLKAYVVLKVRKSGRDGMFLDDESLYLAEHPETLKRLRAGEVVYL